MVINMINSHKNKIMSHTSTWRQGDGVVAHLESSIEIIEEHVKSETFTGVSVAINKWIETLNEHGGFKRIANDLQKLKEAIHEKDGNAIVNLMNKLGEETTNAADKAENGESQKIKMLGKALTFAAKAISKIA